MIQIDYDEIEVVKGLNYTTMITSKLPVATVGSGHVR